MGGLWQIVMFAVQLRQSFFDNVGRVDNLTKNNAWAIDQSVFLFYSREVKNLHSCKANQNLLLYLSFKANLNGCSESFPFPIVFFERFASTMKYLALIILSLLYVAISAQGSQYGIPFITNYSERDYKVSNHNAQIVQDERGILYFANEYGILEFDGSSWTMISGAPNRSNIKSLAIDKNNRIYAGAQGDFGYLDYAGNKGIFFNSLINKIDEKYRDFDNVWNIVVDDDRIIFQTWRALFIYQNDNVEVIDRGVKIKSVFKVQNKIIVQDANGLYRLKGRQFELLVKFGFGEDKIVFVFQHNDALLIGTHENGLFLLENNKLKPYGVSPKVDFESEKISSGLVTEDGDFIIGTRTQGVYFVDKEGKVTENIAKNEGLQNNEVRCVFNDRQNNLWVANKLGIDFVELSTPFRQIVPDSDNPIGVYSSITNGQEILFATHNGLLKYSKNSSSFNCVRVAGSADINWDIVRVNEGYVVAHEKGFSWYGGNELVPIYQGDGGWTVRKIPDADGIWIGGTYSGLVLLKEKNGKLAFLRQIEGFSESSRVMELDEEGNIWVSHGYKGIYQLALSEDLKYVSKVSFYDSKNGLPSDLYNNVFKIQKQIVFGTQHGVYEYEKFSDTIVVHKDLTRMLGEGHVKKMQNDKSGNIWFVTDKSSGVIKKHADGSYTAGINPLNKLLNLYIPGFENVSFDESEKVLLGVKDGVVEFNRATQNIKRNGFNTLLRKVHRFGDSWDIYLDNYVFLCDTVVGKNVELPFRYNGLRFSFSSTFYENIKDLKFKYYLEGYDRDWSAWEAIRYKEYTNLREGDYIFRVKARNIYGETSEEKTYKFSVLPPLHRTIYAYLSYFVLISLMLGLLLKVRTVKLKKEKVKYIAEQERLREIDQARFREEKLNKELEAKNQELTSAANKVIYKNEKLTELKEKLQNIMKYASDRVEKKLKGVLTFIEGELENDDWNEFELRFDQAHDNFINNLKEEYPVLTSKDLKICAYLKMNLSSKEIAQLLNMTVRGVENSRYRIRKRLELDSSVNLTEWIISRK